MGLRFLLLACCLAGCTHTPVVDEAPVPVSPVRAAQKFFQPVYPAMDCEMVGRAHKDEIDEHFPALFFFLDRNHDRTITQRELMDAQANASEEQRLFLFEQMDLDKSGSVTTEEYRDYAYRAFDLLDVDGDGDLTEREVNMISFRKVAKQ